MTKTRKYRAEAYIPQILAVLTNSPAPLSRKQIAAKIGAEATSIATAMLDLTKSGQIVKLPHTHAVGATYRLPIDRPQHDKRTWLTKQAFAWSPQSPVSLPREPWADTVPAERVEGGKDARKPSGQGSRHGTSSEANCNFTTEVRR